MSFRTHETPIRVRYAETDRMGVAYHANYLVWFEAGRTELMREAGFPYARIEAEGMFLPVTAADCRLISPARYDDLLTVTTEVAEVRTRQVVFRYELRRGDVLLATGSTTHTPIAQGGGVVSLPPLFRELLGAS